MSRVRTALLDRRATRVRPATDTKVLAGWNGLAASSLAEAGATLGRPDWITAAAEAVRFVLTTMRVNGRLMRSYRSANGKPVIKHMAFCEDYGFVVEACLSLYEATGDFDWLDDARWAADEALRLFGDSGSGGFFTTGNDAEALVTRPKDLFDNAIPAANSVMALELQRLTHFTGEISYQEHAVRAMKLVLPTAVRSPTGFGHMLSAVDFYTDRADEIVIVGSDEHATTPFVEVVRGRWLPNKVLIVAHDPDDDVVKKIPLLQGRATSETKAYVCHDGTCELPVTTPEHLAAQLDAG